MAAGAGQRAQCDLGPLRSDAQQWHHKTSGTWAYPGGNQGRGGPRRAGRHWGGRQSGLLGRMTDEEEEKMSENPTVSEGSWTDGSAL